MRTIIVSIVLVLGDANLRGTRRLETGEQPTNWECAHYVDGMSGSLCSTNPIIDDKEYYYAEGDGTCGGCWCCRRDMPPGTTTSTIAAVTQRAQTWECAHYVNGMSNSVCSTNPVVDGKEYYYARGDGTCGGCWCCRRDSIPMTTSAWPADVAISPAEPIDYTALAFHADRWIAKNFSLKMYPWMGQNVVLLTATTDEYDRVKMGVFIQNLDHGWATYLDFLGENQPARDLSILNGRAPIAGMPSDVGLSCGMACGAVGSVGIEVNPWNKIWSDTLQRNPMNVPTFFFYEMGRNFFVFGDKHSFATTGFAVFMRYLCVDKVGTLLEASEQALRENVESAINRYETFHDVGFLDTFTSVRLPEKRNRINSGSFHADQPVMYASAMLKLHKELGDDWLRNFYIEIKAVPPTPWDTEQGAQAQLFHWYVAASVAAKADLFPTFAQKWSMPFTANQRSSITGVNWLTAKVSDVIIAAEGHAWGCAHYSGSQSHSWCRTGPVEDVFEYTYAQGNGTCGGCWCCRRYVR